MDFRNPHRTLTFLHTALSTKGHISISMALTHCRAVQHRSKSVCVSHPLIDRVLCQAPIGCVAGYASAMSSTDGSCLVESMCGECSLVDESNDRGSPAAVPNSVSRQRLQCLVAACCADETVSSAVTAAAQLDSGLGSRAAHLQPLSLRVTQPRRDLP